jgi:hypothetical protein
VHKSHSGELFARLERVKLVLVREDNRILLFALDFSVRRRDTDTRGRSAPVNKNLVQRPAALTMARASARPTQS